MADNLNKIQSIATKPVGSGPADLANWVTTGLDRRAEAAATAEYLKKVLTAFIHKIYTVDGGVNFNVYRTGQIRCGSPWGSKAHDQYDVCQYHARVLRHSLKASSERNPNRALFVFRKHQYGVGGYWMVNITEYPTGPDALAWLKHFNMSATKWHQLNESWRDHLARKA